MLLDLKMLYAIFLLFHFSHACAIDLEYQVAVTGGNTEGGPNQNPVNRLNTVTAFFGGGFRENLPAMTQFRSNHACGKYTTHSGTLVISTLYISFQVGNKHFEPVLVCCGFFLKVR